MVSDETLEKLLNSPVVIILKSGVKHYGILEDYDGASVLLYTFNWGYSYESREYIESIQKHMPKEDKTL